MRSALQTVHSAGPVGEEAVQVRQEPHQSRRGRRVWPVDPGRVGGVGGPWRGEPEGWSPAWPGPPGAPGEPRPVSSVGVGVAVTGGGAPRLRGQAQRWAGGAGRKGDRAAAEAPGGESCPFPRGPATGLPGFCHQGPRPKGMDSEPKRNHHFQANTLLRGHTYRVYERPLPSGAHAAGSPRSRGARPAGRTVSPGPRTPDRAARPAAASFSMSGPHVGRALPARAGDPAERPRTVPPVSAQVTARTGHVRFRICRSQLDFGS